MKAGFSGERSIVLPPMVVEMQQSDPLTSNLYLTDIGYYPHARHHFRERSRGIAEHVLIYCVDGSGWYRIDKRKYTVQAGDYFILPAGQPHAYGADRDEAWTIYWLHFGGVHAGIYAEGAQEPQRINTALNSRIHNRNNIFEEMMSILSKGYSLEHLRYASALLHHYLGTMRYLDLYRGSGGSSTQQGDYIDSVEAAIHYMQEHVEQHVTIADILGYVGYSQSHFTSLFRHRTGYSPIAYMNQLKVQAACQLLDNTSLRINQICYKIGIDDPYYFSRLFTKTMGLSPLAYRERQKG